ncbi:MAG: response regulator [Chromatiaceae bacterium]|nr:response regulator [Gammaproteobacteria bacterium]MCP5298066.1 response regulator [Chromatiaceae bacterium]MCP5306979.1 response regulator [Chromatiaceae bacterium]MCP5423393.1 response regulator [Chromatiaceae bacterium]
MPSKAAILAIDDDKVSQKMIRRALEPAGYVPSPAYSGEEGLAAALENPPDVILLDVEMPGMNGYDVCTQLRQDRRTRDVPVIFLSSHSSLRERMQGYEVGADDYLVKPFEAENLVARIGVLQRFKAQRADLLDRYEAAKHTAMIAMTGTSELGTAMQFLERSHSLDSLDDLADALFEVTRVFELSCCLLVCVDDEQNWFVDGEGIRPLEKELVLMSDRAQRFVDFGNRTIINYQYLSLLVRNMPVHDMQRYGRTKDLLPLLLSAVDTRIANLFAEEAMMRQSRELLAAFGRIRSSVYHFARNLIRNQEQSDRLLRDMLQDLNQDFLRLGLEEDQEAYVLNRIDSAVEEAIEKIDASDALRDTLLVLLPSLRSVYHQQQEMVDTFTASHNRAQSNAAANLGDIELF